MNKFKEMERRPEEEIWGWVLYCVQLIFHQFSFLSAFLCIVINLCIFLNPMELLSTTEDLKTVPTSDDASTSQQHILEDLNRITANVSNHLAH